MGMARVLVVFATKSGCTGSIAERVAEVLGRSGHRVTLSDVRRFPDPADFDAVVAGSGVRAGRWHKVAQTWLLRHAEVLRNRPLALFTVGLRIAEPGREAEVRRYMDPLLREAQLSPLDLGLFAGLFEAEGFSFIERMLLKAMKVTPADHRDWAVIEAWAAQVARGF